MAENKDCFAYEEAAGGTCIALRQLYCKKKKCGFYKSKEQHNIDVKKSKERSERYE